MKKKSFEWLHLYVSSFFQSNYSLYYNITFPGSLVNSTQTHTCIYIIKYTFFYIVDIYIYIYIYIYIIYNIYIYIYNLEEQYFIRICLN